MEMGGRLHAFLTVVLVKSAFAVKTISSFPPNLATFHTIQFSLPLYFAFPELTLILVFAVLSGTGILMTTFCAKILDEYCDLTAILNSTRVDEISFTTAWTLKGSETLSVVRYLRLMPLLKSQLAKKH